MNFVVALEAPPKLPERVYLKEPDDGSYDFPSLMIEACSHLNDAGFRFLFGGFGSEDWNLDAEYDLAVFVEQLPDAIAAIRADLEFEIDMYSQGIEQNLVFRSSMHAVRIQCVSRTDWIPNPDTEFVGRTYLFEMLSKFAWKFANSLEVIRSPVAQCVPFSRWILTNG